MEGKQINFLYREEDINWQDLESIGILKSDLKEKGQMNKLLRGEKTDLLNFNIMLLGLYMDVEVTIQIVEAGNEISFEIEGIQSEE